jgi:hypothetical protein
MAVVLGPLANRAGLVAVGPADFARAALAGPLDAADVSTGGDELVQNILQLFPVGGVQVDLEVGIAQAERARHHVFGGPVNVVNQFCDSLGNHIFMIRALRQNGPDLDKNDRGDMKTQLILLIPWSLPHRTWSRAVGTARGCAAGLRRPVARARVTPSAVEKHRFDCHGVHRWIDQPWRGVYYCIRADGADPGHIGPQVTRFRPGERCSLSSRGSARQGGDEENGDADQPPTMNTNGVRAPRSVSSFPCRLTR